MYDEFFAERLAKLRAIKGISARDMSLSLGQSENYINKIENKRSMPSMSAFFNICEYLEISPSEFFNEGINNPEAVNNIVQELVKFDEDSLDYILGIARKINSKKD